MTWPARRGRAGGGNVGRKSCSPRLSSPPAPSLPAVPSTLTLVAARPSVSTRRHVLPSDRSFRVAQTRPSGPGQQHLPDAAPPPPDQHVVAHARHGRVSRVGPGAGPRQRTAARVDRVDPPGRGDEQRARRKVVGPVMVRGRRRPDRRRGGYGHRARRRPAEPEHGQPGDHDEDQHQDHPRTPPPETGSVVVELLRCCHVVSISALAAAVLRTRSACDTRRLGLPGQPDRVSSASRTCSRRMSPCPTCRASSRVMCR
jgi:hypothetical protein